MAFVCMGMAQAEEVNTSATTAGAQEAQALKVESKFNNLLLRLSKAPRPQTKICIHFGFEIEYAIVDDFLRGIAFVDPDDDRSTIRQLCRDQSFW